MTWRLITAVAIGLGVSSQAGCGRDETPCLSWIDIGSTYSVEALQRLAPLLPDGSPRRELPYASFDDEPSCEGLLGDSIDGETLGFEAVELITSETGSCAVVTADVMLPGEVEQELRGTRTVAATFRRVARIRTSQGCAGEYTIGLVRVLDAFLDSEGDAALSDYMIVREFFPEPGDASCRELPDLGNPCADSWYARVTGPSGTQISRDADALGASR